MHTPSRPLSSLLSAQTVHSPFILLLISLSLLIHNFFFFPYILLSFRHFSLCFLFFFVYPPPSNRSLSPRLLFIFFFLVLCIPLCSPTPAFLLYRSLALKKNNMLNKIASAFQMSATECVQFAPSIVVHRSNGRVACSHKTKTRAE